MDEPVTSAALAVAAMAAPQRMADTVRVPAPESDAFCTVSEAPLNAIAVSFEPVNRVPRTLSAAPTPSTVIAAIPVSAVTTLHDANHPLTTESETDPRTSTQPRPKPLRSVSDVNV